MSRPTPRTAAELIGFGWEIAEATLAAAATERTLVTHWFLTPEDAGVNRDEHFGSDERTLRFLSAALPTFIDQLESRLTVVALPWGLEIGSATLTVLGLGGGEPAQLETRLLTRRPTAHLGPPFWRLGMRAVTPPPELAEVASGFNRLA